MEQNKKEILLELSTKIDDILKKIESDFDLEDDDIQDEYSYLSIVNENLKEKASN